MLEQKDKRKLVSRKLWCQVMYIQSVYNWRGVGTGTNYGWQGTSKQTITLSVCHEGVVLFLLLSISLYHLFTETRKKAKEKYDSECAKQANLESQLTSILLRDAERVKNKLERCRAEVNTLGTKNTWEPLERTSISLNNLVDNEYQSACLKLTEATAIWNAEWKIACDVSHSISLSTESSPY
jgi:hypothetical protein